jgi:hypothetical protein
LILIGSKCRRRKRTNAFGRIFQADFTKISTQFQDIWDTILQY